MNHNMNRNNYENYKTYRQRDDFVEEHERCHVEVKHEIL